MAENRAGEKTGRKVTDHGLTGMTGFARQTGAHEAFDWTWEARSVNGKSLDVRLRLPSEFSDLDSPIRKYAATVFSRGNIQFSFNFVKSGSDKIYQVNQPLLDLLKSSSGDGDIATLLTVPGVIEETIAVITEAQREALNAAILESFKQLCTQLKSARDAEGQALYPLLAEAVTKVEDYTAQAAKLADRLPEDLKTRFESKLSALLADNLSPDRLAQEAALLAIKADIREETDRLVAHCEQARILLAKGSPIGRKLDFLSQEFNRETNTLCSKSADIDLTQIGLELKSVIEQFREQAANVE